MSTLPYELRRDLNITHDVDVCVIGGGPGGLGAAVMAARAGARTLLVERNSALGGMASIGEVQPFMANHADLTCLDKPVYVQWVKAMKHYLADNHPFKAVSSDDLPTYGDRIICKDAAMLAAEDLCIEAGVELLYHHNLLDVQRTGQHIDAVVLHSKSGLTAVRARQFVDCTGDADLAALAGCETEMGGPSGHCQPMTLCFKLTNVDMGDSRNPNDYWNLGKRLSEIYQQGKASGEIDCPRENVLIFSWLTPNVVHFNTTRVIHKNAVNALELSEAEIIARRQLRQLLQLLRQRAPEFRDCEIHSIAHHIGVRETRRVCGLNYVTREDFVARSKFTDAIARVSYPIDIHNPDGQGTELIHMPKGDWYEIPYGCVVARDVDNLTVGGRPISVDHAIHSSMRVMPSACSVGQAAGLAAALAAQRQTSPQKLDGSEVRARLIEQGAWLA